MAVAPDTRHYIHASTHVARAEQGRLLETAIPRRSSRGEARARAFDLRTDWWIFLALSALAGTMALLVIFVR